MHPKPVELNMSRIHPQPAEEPAAPPPPAEAPAPPGEPLTPEQVKALEEKIVAALCTCFDPEIPVNIYELGLIYDIAIEEDGSVGIRMTLTSPGCPVAGSLPGEVEAKVRSVPGVRSAKVDVVWDPPWHKDLMSDAAKLQLGLFD